MLELKVEYLWKEIAIHLVKDNRAGLTIWLTNEQSIELENQLNLINQKLKDNDQNTRTTTANR